MARKIAIIGFGEAAQSFVGAPNWSGVVQAYDKLTDDPATRAAKVADYEALGVLGAGSLRAALGSAETIFSLVTSDQALGVAMATISLPEGSVYCDMNSVSPGTKQAAASAVEERRGRYVDVAIMAPVKRLGLSVPLLLSGPAAKEAEERLRDTGFQNVRIIGEHVGTASAVKMIRSVVVKGLEALTGEAMLAAAAAGVTDEVLASLDSSERAVPWRVRADYNLERMIVHGVRRAEEMQEAVTTLESLGVDPELTRGSVRRHREIGLMGLHPAEGLDAKLVQLMSKSALAA
jgi:3-hydroxyisobutyrate dehydrogenase-like beta-hydroxyacid dehydrogenase